MRFQVGSRTETFLANVALVRFFSSVHQMVLLQMGQLRKALGAYITFEWSFT